VTRPRLIGMIGGMSWESSAEYYRLANELVAARLGGLHSARLILASVDFAEVERLQVTGQWDEAGRLLAGVAQGLEAAGAELLVLCTNTMHKVVIRCRRGIDPIPAPGRRHRRGGHKRGNWDHRTAWHRLHYGARFLSRSAREP
jgi:aspartate/glutamate racemase